MKQSYASAGKAPRRRVHSLSGIAAIAVCGLPPPRIVIGLYGAFFVKGWGHPFVASSRPCFFILFFGPPPQHSSSPAANWPSPSLATRGNDGAFSAPPQASPCPT